MVELLEKTIQENIVLHKRLSGLVRNESVLFTEDKLDDVKITEDKRKQIESKILTGNMAIDLFFKGVASGKIVISEVQKTKLASLLNDLKDSVLNTIFTAEHTEKELLKQRTATLKDLKVFGKGKKAISSYTRNTQIL